MYEYFHRLPDSIFFADYLHLLELVSLTNNGIHGKSKNVRMEKSEISAIYLCIDLPPWVIMI